jgi:hypothetical protein
MAYQPLSTARRLLKKRIGATGAGAAAGAVSTGAGTADVGGVVVVVVVVVDAGIPVVLVVVDRTGRCSVAVVGPSEPPCEQPPSATTPTSAARNGRLRHRIA